MGFKLNKDLEIIIFLKMAISTGKNKNDFLIDNFLIPVILEGPIFKTVLEPLLKDGLRSAKNIIETLKQIRQYNHAEYRETFYSNEFKQEIEKLKIPYEYEKIPKIAAEKLVEITQGKTFNERWHKTEELAERIKKEKNFLKALGISLPPNRNKKK
jgi:hypothetical protein